MSDYLKIMKDLVYESGKISEGLMGNSNPSLKGDKTVVTEADKTISKLTHDHLQGVIQLDGHILVDEEDTENAKFLSEEALKPITHIWSIDPIDGTRIYANHMKHYGISIGLMKDLKPHMGVVYFPGLSELFFCDGDKSYFVQNAFSNNEKLTEIKKLDLPIHSNSVFFCHDSFFMRFNWDNTSCRAMILACAVVDMCWPAMGRGVGGCLQPALWDFSGSWPIARSAGLEMWSYETGKILDHVDISRFRKESSPWELNELHVLASEENFKIIQEKMRSVEKNFDK